MAKTEKKSKSGEKRGGARARAPWRERVLKHLKKAEKLVAKVAVLDVVKSNFKGSFDFGALAAALEKLPADFKPTSASAGGRTLEVGDVVILREKYAKPTEGEPLFKGQGTVEGIALVTGEGRAQRTFYNVKTSSGLKVLPANVLRAE